MKWTIGKFLIAVVATCLVALWLTNRIGLVCDYFPSQPGMRSFVSCMGIIAWDGENTSKPVGEPVE